MKKKHDFALHLSAFPTIHETIGLWWSLATAFVYNHVFVVPQKHLAVLIVQHAQWAHFGWGTAGGRSPLWVIMFEQTLEEHRKTDYD